MTMKKILVLMVLMCANNMAWAERVLVSQSSSESIQHALSQKEEWDLKQAFKAEYLKSHPNENGLFTYDKNKFDNSGYVNPDVDKAWKEHLKSQNLNIGINGSVMASGEKNLNSGATTGANANKNDTPTQSRKEAAEAAIGNGSILSEATKNNDEENSRIERARSACGDGKFTVTKNGASTNVHCEPKKVATTEPVAKVQDSNIKVVNGKEVDCGLRQNSDVCLAPAKLRKEPQPILAEKPVAQKTETKISDQSGNKRVVNGKEVDCGLRQNSDVCLAPAKSVQDKPADQASDNKVVTNYGTDGKKGPQIETTYDEKGGGRNLITRDDKGNIIKEVRVDRINGQDKDTTKSVNTNAVKAAFPEENSRKGSRNSDTNTALGGHGGTIKTNSVTQGGVTKTTTESTGNVKPATTFSESFKKEKGGPGGSTDGLIADSLSGKLYKDLGTVPGVTSAVTPSAQKPTTPPAASGTTPQAKPVGTFSESIKKGNPLDTSSNGLVVDSLSGKLYKDLGTVPGVAGATAKPASTMVDLSNSAKNADGTMRSPASAAPAKAAKPVLTETEIKLSKVNSQLKIAETKQKTAHDDYDGAAKNLINAQKIVQVKEEAVPLAAAADKRGIKANEKSKLPEALSEQKKAKQYLSEAENHLATQGKAEDSADKEVKELKKERDALRATVKTEKAAKPTEARTVSKEEFVMQAAGECPKGDAECAKKAAEEAAKKTEPVATVTEKPVCEHGTEEDGTCKKEPEAITTKTKEKCPDGKTEKPADGSACPSSTAEVKKCSDGSVPSTGHECPSDPTKKPGSQVAAEDPTKSVCDTAGEPQTDFAQFKGVNAGPGFANCILVTQGKIFDYTKINTVDDWINFYCAIDNINEKFGGGKKQNSKHVMTRSLFLKSDEFMNAQKCMMGAHILKNAQRDYKNGDHTQSSSKEKGDEYGCKTSGYDTVDYDDCVAFKDHAVAADTAKAVATQAQAMKYQMDMQDEQLKASKSPDQATASLSSQKTSFELQKQMMNQQAAVEAATFAVLENDKSNMPDVETIKGWCSDVTSKLPASDLNLKKDTCEALASNRTFDFLMNEKANDAMKKKLIKVGADAALDLLKANMLGKQAEQVGNAIAAIKGITPTAPTGPTMADMKAQLCQLAPTDPTCVGGPGLARTFGTAGNNDAINFGNGGQGSVYSPGTLNPNTAAGGGAGAALGTPNAKGSFGTNTVAAPHVGGLKDTAAAAQFDNKGGGASGGGGGGGAAGGGSGGGGGGGPTGGAGGGVQSAVAGKAPSYGGGGFSMMGGFGISKGGKTADSGNPFGKMFDKGPKGDMNFRAPASAMGNKNDNIFEMITKRYNNVSTDKRLMEYEQPK